MADIPIHRLPLAGPLEGGEIIPIDDGTATVRTTVAAVRAGLAPLVSPAFTGTPTVNGSRMILAAADGGVLAGAVPVTDGGGHVLLRVYTAAALPSPSPAGRLAVALDAANVPRVAVADGTAWHWPADPAAAASSTLTLSRSFLGI